MSQTTSDVVAVLERFGEVTETSLTLPADMSYDRYEALGVALVQAGSKINWWTADWIVYGQRRFPGDIYLQAAAVTGLSEETLKNYVRTAERIPPERRRPELRLSHHTEVATNDLSPGEQDAWLARASSEGWNRRELRDQLRPVKHLPPLGPTLEEAARDLVRSARAGGAGLFLVGRASFVDLCAALGEDVPE